MKALTYVEIDLEYCANTYGSAPCTASIGVTGTRRCYQSYASCQDRPHFVNAPNTYRFAKNTDYLPNDIEAVPNLLDVAFSPATISMGQNLGQRATLTMTFQDHPHSDTGAGFDKYLSTRGFDPYRQGTFWGKFRARHKYLQGRPIRLIRGLVGQSLAAMEKRHYVIENFDGPDAKGNYKIVAKDVLKLADNDRAQAPALSTGFILSNITAAATSLTLTPSSIGDAEYDGDGYLALGGSEIVQFTREGGDDAWCSLLLHCNGANGSTTFADDSDNAFTVTRAGNTQISTAQSVFGGASGLFDGTGDFLTLGGQSAFAFGLGDFTIDYRVRHIALPGGGARQQHIDFRPSSGAVTGISYLAVSVTDTGSLRVENGADVITSTSNLAINTWYHIALSRKANQLRLFIGGVLQGSVYKDYTSHGVGASRPVIGAQGSNTANRNFNGYIDELRITKAKARWSLAFTPPAAAYTTGTGDTVALVARGQFGTTAQDHSAQDRVQTCLLYQSLTPADILYDLFTRYARIPAAYIPKSAWDTELDAYLQRVYSTLIAEPGGVNRLASELIEQAALAVWWDDMTQTIRLQVLRQIFGAEVLGPGNIIEGSLSIKDQPEKRKSQVWTYFGIINPLESGDEPQNYRSAALTVALQSESDYGAPAIQRVYSRWIAPFGRSVALRLNDLVLSRYRDAPRAFQFEIMRRGPELIRQGGGYFLEWFSLQDDTGAIDQVPIQIVRLNPKDDVYQVEAEELLAAPFDAADLLNRTVIIDANTFNLNLRAAHDALYQVITDPTGITVTCIIETNVIVGSHSTSLPAVDVGSWVASLDIVVKVKGRIQAKGGIGGGDAVRDGQAGGTALYTRYPIDIEINEIHGGGGGGAALVQGGSGAAYGGGGGAGTDVGPGGGGSAPALNGAPGTATVGGIGYGTSALNKAGDGGGPGTAGGNGGNYGSGVSYTGGVAGNAIDGVSFLTVVVSGSVLGPQIN